MSPEAIEADAIARALLTRYARASDRLDEPALAPLYWDDARIDMGAIYQGGLAGFLPVWRDFMGGCLATRHEVTNVTAERLTRDEIGAEGYVQAWHRLAGPEGEAELLVFGRYLVRIARRGGEWRIAAQAEVIDWGRLTAADPSWFNANAELPKGARGQADPARAWLRAGALPG